MGTTKKGKVIGFVSSTIRTPADESVFEFIIKKNNGREISTINQFDLIRVRRTPPAKGSLYAVVESVSSVSDAPDHIANYVSQNFGTGDNVRMSRMGFYLVKAKVLKNESNDYFPVKTGDLVYTVTPEQAYKVLYQGYDDGKNYFGVTRYKMYGEDGQDMSLNLNKRYIVGPDAAHLNVSGMSGVASKTTKVMTFLRELYHSDDKISIVIFNTKDRDLLHPEAISQGLNKRDKQIYEKLRNHREDKWTFQTYEPRGKDPEGYVLKFEEQRNNENIDLLTAMDLDDTGTLDSCVKLINSGKAYTKLKEVKEGSRKKKDVDKTSTIKSWRGLTDVKFASEDNINSSSTPKFCRVVSRVLTENALNSGIFSDGEESEDLTKVIKDRLSNKEQNVTIIDIAPLDSLQQGVVFGAVIREIKKFCTEKMDKDKRVAVFIDEFNKYASIDVSPQDPILKSLIDIAEAGRSIGLGLVTAEQSYSIINQRIKANYANLIIGRTGVAELNQVDYMMIPDSYKRRIGTFDHGDAVLYTTYLNSGLLYASFPDKFYE